MHDLQCLSLSRPPSYATAGYASSCCITKVHLKAQERISSAPGECEPLVLRPGPRPRPGFSAKEGAMGPSASGDVSALANGVAPWDAGPGFFGFSHRVGPVKGPIRCTLGLGICRQPGGLSHRPIYGVRSSGRQPDVLDALAVLLVSTNSCGWWPGRLCRRRLHFLSALTSAPDPRFSRCGTSRGGVQQCQRARPTLEQRGGSGLEHVHPF